MIVLDTPRPVPAGNHLVMTCGRLHIGLRRSFLLAVGVLLGLYGGGACKPQNSLGTGAAGNPSTATPKPLQSPEAWGAAIAKAYTIAKADFADEVARRPMPALPAGVSLDVMCCYLTSVATHPVGAPVTLRFPPPEDLPPSAERRPTHVISAYQIDIMQDPPQIVHRPDFDLVRRDARREAEAAQTALAVARARWVTLERYREWRRADLGYTTNLLGNITGNTVWTVFFRTQSDEHIDYATIEVDIASRKVTGIFVGAERRALPL